MSEVLTEITPLSDKDLFYIVDRHKSEFMFPLHRHRDYELNFIENGRGVRRIVGDSVEEIGDFDLTLVAGEGLEHAWEQGNCTSRDVREITIQFSPELFHDNILARNQFAPISTMLSRAAKGLNFSMHSVMKVYSRLDTLASEPDGFKQYLSFLSILNDLASDDDARALSSGSFAHAERTAESRRIVKIKQYIHEHYNEDIRVETLAGLAGMTPSSLSRFFKSRTGRTVMDYIIDIRLGNAARMLVDTAQNISEICYNCGFNNLSNFNRIFKSKRGYTPRDFRTLFKRNRVFV